MLTNRIASCHCASFTCTAVQLCADLPELRPEARSREVADKLGQPTTAQGVASRALGNVSASSRSARPPAAAGGDSKLE